MYIYICIHYSIVLVAARCVGPRDAPSAGVARTIVLIVPNMYTCIHIYIYIYIYTICTVY